jgi:pimeloyl-ACP methyl ester carboxylesterase
VAVRHAASVERLVIGNSFCDPTPAQTPDKLEALQGRSAEAVKDEMMGRIGAGPDSELKQVQLELVGRCQGAELLHARLLAVQRAAPVPTLGVPDERVLLVECDNDPLIPPPMRAALRAAHPQARHVTVPDGGHYPYLLRAEAYNEAVGAFLGLG